MNKSETSLTIYRPSYFRCLLTVASGLIFALLIFAPLSFLLSKYTGKDFIASLVGNVFFYLLLSPVLAVALKQRSITITNNAILGKRAWGVGRVGFHLTELDKYRSNRRNIYQKLFGSQYIYSTDGDRVMFELRNFTKRQREEIYKRLGLDLI